MDRPYDNIPRAGGAHEKDIDAEHSGMNVRAPQPPDEGGRESTADRVMQISANESTGCYRMSRPTSERPEGFEDVCMVDLSEGVDPALEQFGNGPFWVVLENEDTGDVFYEADYNLSDNWTGDGQFDVVTVFPSEEAAAAYVSERTDEPRP